jgi:hypothetical protein
LFEEGDDYTRLWTEDGFFVGKSSSPPRPKGTAVKRQSKANIFPNRELSEYDWDMVRELEPALAMTMLRNRYKLSNMGSVATATWLRDNMQGFYYSPTSSVIMFEKEEDVVLFLARYQGSQS